MRRMPGWGRRNRLGIAAAAIVAAVHGGWLATATADDTNVDRFGYTNKGAYEGCLEVGWKTSKGETYYVSDGSHCVLSGHTIYWRLDNLAKHYPLTAGSEVWGEIRIPLVDVKSCRKEVTKFYYQPDAGVTVEYRTRGTTENFNRCRIHSVGDAPYEGSQAEAPGADRSNAQ